MAVIATTIGTGRAGIRRRPADGITARAAETASVAAPGLPCARRRRRRGLVATGLVRARSRRRAVGRADEMITIGRIGPEMTTANVGGTQGHRLVNGMAGATRGDEVVFVRLGLL